MIVKFGEGDGSGGGLGRQRLQEQVVHFGLSELGATRGTEYGLVGGGARVARLERRVQTFTAQDVTAKG